MAREADRAVFSPAGEMHTFCGSTEELCRFCAAPLNPTGEPEHIHQCADGGVAMRAWWAKTMADARAEAWKRQAPRCATCKRWDGPTTINGAVLGACDSIGDLFSPDFGCIQHKAKG